MSEIIENTLKASNTLCQGLLDKNAELLALNSKLVAEVERLRADKKFLTSAGIMMRKCLEREHADNDKLRAQLASIGVILDTVYVNSWSDAIARDRQIRDVLRGAAPPAKEMK